MKQIVQSYKDGKILLADTPEPACKAGGVLVQNVVSLISPGTEKLMIETGRKSILGKARSRPDLVRQAWAKAKKEGFLNVWREAMHRLDEPIPLGYSAAGVVSEAGGGVRGFKPGDRVAVAGAGYASHAEVLWVPENLCVHVPAEVPFEAAAFVTLGGIALHGVREAALTLGERAVVIGLGLLGLLSVQLLKAQGCRVVGVDLDQHKGKLARELGADLVLVPGSNDVEAAVANFTGGLGADAVLITAASDDPRPIRLAEAVARARARVVLVGVAELSLTRKTFWEKELIFTVSKAAGPGSLAPLYEAKGFDYPLAYVRWTERRNLEAFLDLMAQGRVQVDRLITHRFPLPEALGAYDLILANREPYIGVLLLYSREGGEPVRSLTSRRTIWLKTAAASENSERLTVGLIGGGLFTKNVLLPVLKKIKGVHLKGVATTTGATAQHLARKFGFAFATTDYQELLQDPEIGSILITTRHNLHAPFVIEALARGKNVFVEKPLCLTLNELQKILAAYDGTRILMVGFNRRFAPMAQMLKDSLQNRRTPLVMVYRVNAGFIPADHWIHDPEIGGGRLVGEACHFVDFLQYLCDAKVTRVKVESISGELGKYYPEDNFVISLIFADGSIGTIIYTSKGSKSFSRERVEVFCNESVYVIEDFKRGCHVEGSKVKKIKYFSMDMGYKAELGFFFKEVNINSLQSLTRSQISSSLATLAAQSSFVTGKGCEVNYGDLCCY